jgi:hypothetical protein
MKDPNQNKKGRSVWLPLVAFAAVAAVGTVGLVRGCSYAAEPTPAERPNAEAVRDAPDE